jgi:hypothetical protein
MGQAATAEAMARRLAEPGQSMTQMAAETVVPAIVVAATK